MNEVEKKDNNKNPLYLFVLIILVVLFILSLGIFSKKKKEQKLLEEKKNRLGEVKIRISELKPQKETIEKNEKKIIIWVRISICILLIVSNYMYMCRMKGFSLEYLLNLNGAILLGYSFVAFMLFGTIENLIKVLKAKLAYFLRKKHFDSLLELEQLLNEKNILEKEISELEKES